MVPDLVFAVRTFKRKTPPGTAYLSISYFSRKTNWWQATKLAG